MNARKLFPMCGRAALLALAGFLLPETAVAQDQTSSDELRFTTGVAGVLDHDRDGHFRLEYHFARKLFYELRPYLTGGYSADGSFHAGAGLEYTDFLTDGWRFTLASGPVYYDSHGGIDLGYDLEFISYAEIATEIGPRVWLGANFAHISNAGLSRTNPGREMVGISLSFGIR